ncbi:MAG: hypothetical protein QXX06_03760 [Candidatus Diapherotrites archaeon]
MINEEIKKIEKNIKKIKNSELKKTKKQATFKQKQGELRGQMLLFSQVGVKN